MKRMDRVTTVTIKKILGSIAGATLLLSSFTGCGGGGGGHASTSTYTAGVFQPSSTYAAKCATPRTGTNSQGQRYPDVQGSTLLENNWLRSWTNELYLWYSEVPDLDPSTYSTTAAYFDVLKTPQMTATGHPKDKFHFTYVTSVWEALSQSGVQAGYGAEFSVISGTPPRRVVVAYVEPVNSAPANGPATNLSRGEEIITVDNVDVVSSSSQSAVDTLNAGLFPSAAGSQHTFGIRELNGTTRTVTMTSASVTSTPVQNVKIIGPPLTPVGYLLFNDHVATSEALLISAIKQLQSAQVVDLILDIRYNGGGYLAIASELAYMIAGAQHTAGKTFEETQFNTKNPTVDPVTHQTIAPMPFLNVSQGFSGPSNQALPSLNLNRVYVLTGPTTCSASEAIINSLDGAGVPVIQIGSTTCGKPYGFYPQDNCGTTYFSIEFRGVNNQGYGDYTDGFAPPNAATAGSKTLQGCAVGDDFTHALGDPNEARVAAALGYRLNGMCPTPPTGLSKPSFEQALSATDGVVPKNPFLENRILTR